MSKFGLKKCVTAACVFFCVALVAVVLYANGLPGDCITCMEKDVRTVSAQEIDTIRACRKASARQMLTLTYGSEPVPVYDESENTYLFCDALVGGITLEGSARCQIVKSEDGGGTTLLAYTNRAYRTYRIERTNLPVLCLQTIGGPISDTFREGELTIFDPNGGSAQRVYASFKVRGRSSKLLYPKKSFTIKFLDERIGKETTRSLLGLTADTRFALNSLYEDDSKVRDQISLSLWDDMSQDNAATGADYGIDFTPAEVLLNGEYWGLYGVQERIGQSALTGSEPSALYKVDSYLIPQCGKPAADAESWTNVLCECSSFADPWEFFSKFVASAFYSDDDVFCATIGESLDWENCRDYYLYIQLLYASDNIWKNVVLAQVQNEAGEARLLLLPWDVDQSFGAQWDENAALKVGFNMGCATELVPMNSALPLQKLWTLDAEGFRRATAERWFVLRGNLFSEESLLARVDEALDAVSRLGARDRDAVRWPKSAYRGDDAFIRAFIEKRLAYLDAFYAGVLAGDEEN